ncbi:MAG: hypothetical protein AAF203_01090 [Pseudomonadota bacterium]
MKNFFFGFLSILITTSAFAGQNAIQETECTLQILKEGKQPYILHGSIREKTGFDYLTLEPNTVSGAKFSARVLLTGNYDPVTIHPRGNTVNTVARGDLAQSDEVSLEYYDSANKTDYFLYCQNL